jgi:trimeric autotransporter adhesin
MEPQSHVSFESWSTRFSLAAGLVIMVFIAGTVGSAGAQAGNTSLGTSALVNNTTGKFDTAVGFAALFLNQTGSNNTAIGAGVLQSNSVSYNTGVGYQALLDNTTGRLNTATGAGALLSNTTGASNSATAAGALGSNTTGSSNAADGYGALTFNKTGSENAAIGYAALAFNTTGSNNTAVGWNAGSDVTTGDNNIAVGSQAGENLGTGNNNIDIGNVGVAGESNAIRIGTKSVQTRAVIAGISGTPIYSGSAVLVNANGRLGVAVSSARYKRDIRDMGAASDRLTKLRPVTFRYKEDSAGTVQFGLVAEEVARVYPELVTNGDDGKPETVAYYQLPAMLLNEVQKQVRENRRKDAEIAALRKQVESLEKERARIDGLTARLSALEQQARGTAMR